MKNNCGYENCNIDDCCIACKFYRKPLCYNGKSKYFKKFVHECSGCTLFSSIKRKRD